MFAAFFVAVAVYNRLDFTITKDERWLEKQAHDKALGLIQQLVAVWDGEMHVRAAEVAAPIAALLCNNSGIGFAEACCALGWMDEAAEQLQKWQICLHIILRMSHCIWVGYIVAILPNLAVI